MKATGLLLAEHTYILRALDVLDRMAARTAQGEALDLNDVEDVLSFLRFFADDHHQAKEEFVLFPALLKASHSEEHACLCRLTFEHNRERSLVEGVEDALRCHNGSDFVYYAQRLSRIVRDHITEENEVLFKLADKLLSPEDDERIAQEIATFDSPSLKKTLIRILEALVALELKYTGTNAVCERPTYV